MLELVLTLALTIYGEAAGESFEGKQAVASVIWNRAQGVHERLEGVCRAEKQFSCWNNGRVPHVKQDIPSQQAWYECVRLAEAMAHSDRLRVQFRPSTPATHYHNGSVNPKWAKKMKRVNHIGRHYFYQDK